MRPAGVHAGLLLLGGLILGIGAATGCGNPNEDGFGDIESTVAPDAPTTQEEFFQQESQGNASK